MPAAMSVAGAEVERRLVEIQRRLNRRALTRALCSVGGALLCLLAAVVWAAAHGSAQLYTTVAYAAAGAGFAALAATAWRLRKGRLSLLDTAHLVDRQGRLQERLSTALWVQQSGTRPRLAPALIADTLARQLVWAPDRIAPRRLPRAAYFPVGGLALLALAVLLAPPAAPPPAKALASAATKLRLPAPLNSLNLARRWRGGSETDAKVQVSSSLSARVVPSGARAADNDGLGGAYLQTPQAPVTATGTGESGGRGGTTSAQRRRLGGGEQLSNGRKPSQPAGEKQSRRGPATSEKKQRASAHAAGRRGGDETKRAKSGPAARAASGSSPTGLLSPKPAAGLRPGQSQAAAGKKAGTFPLALNSFLESTLTRKLGPAANAPAPGPAATAENAGAGLSPKQAAEDAIRRAAIPERYEELVRRVYSARPAQ